jgi:hypothetical protein
LEGIQVPQGIKDGGLYCVFGIFPIVEDSLNAPKDGILMGHHKTRKCRSITRPGARQQDLFLLCH